MPAIGRGAGKSAAGERRSRRRPVAPGRPSGVFGGLVRADTPLVRSRDEAAGRGRQARDRMPGRPRAPYVPVVRSPSAAQTLAARRQITGAVTRAVGPGGSGADRLARRGVVEQELLRDPRFRRAVEHYGSADALRVALRRALALGIGEDDRHPGQVFRDPLGGLARRARAGAGDLAARAGRDRVRPGTPPTRLRLPGGVATVDLTALGRTVAGATSLDVGDAGPNRLVRHALGDVRTLASAPLVGGLTLLNLASDPVAGQNLLGSAAIEGAKLVPGVVGHYRDEAAHPGRAFSEHPLLTLLDAAGALSVAGRVGGALARGLGSRPEAGGLRGGLARGGSTVRPPVAFTDDVGAALEGRGLVERRYSKDSLRKLGQVAADAVREPLLDAEGRVVTVTQRGREVPVLRALPGERGVHLRREADFAASRANMVERLARDVAGRETRVRGVRGRRSRDLVSMVVEGTITSAQHFEADLRAHADRLRGELAAHEHAVAAGEASPFRHSGELRAAQARLAGVERALADPRVLAQKERIVAAGEAVGRRLNERDREAQALGIQTPVRAERARRVPVAIEHMAGRYFTPDELRAAARAVAGDSGMSREGRIAALEELARGARASAARQEASGKFAFGRGNAVHMEAAARDADAQVRALRAGLDVEAEAADFRYGAIRKKTGEALTNEEVDAFLRSRGRDPETVAYLPHRLDVRGKRAFHTQFRPGSRGTMEKGETRTGEAYRRGVTESSATLIREQGVRQATQIAKARQLDRMVADQGRRRPDGRYFTATEGRELAERLLEDTGRQWVPMRAFAAKLDAETQRIIREELQGPAGMELLGQRLLNDRIVVADDPAGAARARNVVLVPAEYIERLHKHLVPAGDLEKFLQMLNRPFRFAVLAQPRWLMGQIVEPFFVRLPGVGSGAVNVFGMGADVMAATRLLGIARRSGNPAERLAAEEVQAQQLAGLFVGQRGASVRRDLDELPVAGDAYGFLVARLPVVAQGVDLVRMLGRALMAPGNGYFRLNQAIENVANRASLGRNVRRDLQEMEGWAGSWRSVLGLQEKALEDVMRGAVNTSTQRRWMRETDELLGKYQGFPPWLRRLTQTWMPFLPWALNAARFVLWTMPAHRTVTTSLLLKVNDVVAQDWEEMHRPVPPGGLRLAVPTAAGGWVDLARYTPYGLTGPIAESVGEAPKQALQGVFDQFAPQFSGAVAAVQGEDPFGRALRVDPSENGGRSDPSFGQQLGIAGYGLLEAFVPYLAQIRRVREGGGTAFAGSTVVDPDVKPGTDRMSGLRRTFDPFRPTYLGGGGVSVVDVPGPGAVEGSSVGGVQGALRARSGRGGGLPSGVEAALRARAGVSPGVSPAIQRALRARSGR